ncbi:MAG: flagellar basal-body MS-ring/collar protein FliF [Lachnospiraceae bacterium]|nr:flagellar M-ring protein FliF [Lachnospiraceae bacterium]MCI7594693.1 flagellar M-ring protein FliF [Lachnospiraceae bacterium]MDD7049677.1 flagellar basal-body MS-ring/collar protein FliF [Lachnospiraceae bacterium]MDY3221739.1 flagellar basal-body MS-ring/collar protein FliF [Lachnospiraceae bacterium]MDY4096735.1 flagellar basal-body MS-ring/collar protein FliF [Lachnospiraceae bacterium]
MTDRLKEIPSKILEWWNRYTSKQKTIIISIAAGVVVAMAILITALSRPKYEVLVICESTKEAATITGLLDSSKIPYRISDDGYRIEVEQDQIGPANLLLGANNIPTATFDISNVTGGGLSTTESDKVKLYRKYLESQMKSDLESMENVVSARVQLNIPEDDGTMIAQEKDSSAAIMLTLSNSLTDDQATSIAQYVKTALGNENIKTITIIDAEGKLLFSGDDSYSITGSASSQLNVKQQTESVLQSNIKKVLLGTNEYNLVEVSSNLQLDFSTVEDVTHLFYAPEGQTQGVLSHEDSFEAETTGGTGGVPGTDTNNEDNTDYMMNDYQGGTSTQTEISRDYLPNEKMTTTKIPAGLIKYDDSSLSVAAIKYRVLKEQDAKNQGLLDGITWEDYKAQNQERTKLTVDEDIVDLVAKASGISSENISFIAYEEPMYIDAEGMAVTPTDILQIVLIVLILGLLAFVIIRSMRADKETVEEEEVSVESLLQSTQDSGLEDIEVEAKSETRKLIEKFVNENPEAAANLLRNWLQEDWA